MTFFSSLMNIYFHKKRSTQGSALIITIIVLVVLATVIMSLSSQINTDLRISRNIRLKNEAFNWGDTGLDIAEEMLCYSTDTRGDDANSEFDFNIGGDNFTAENPGNGLYLSNGSLNFSRGNSQLASTSVQFLTRQIQEGGSIILASGYEGLGKGAGSGTGIGLVYLIKSNGTSMSGQGQSRLAETYVYTSGGR